MNPASPASDLPVRRAPDGDDEYEAVDAVPVLGASRELEAASVAPIAVQAAAVAGVSFLAGATAIAIVKGRRRRHPLAVRRRRHGRKVVASHSFLIDVHVLGR